MKDDKEYKKLVSQKSAAQSQYNSCEARIENCEYLLKRLKPVKEDLTELKKEFKSNKKTDSRLKDKKYKWKGSKYSDFDYRMETVVEANDSYYKGSIDYVLDSLNDEITRIENQRLNELGLLGRLGSMINSLANEIENLFN